MSTYTSQYSESVTFNITHARHIASKVATDLKRLQRFYPSATSLTDKRIQDYESEIIELLKAGYLKTVTYGFKRNGDWIEPTLRYTARELADMTANDDDPGRVRPNANIVGASFYSYLTYSSAWSKLSLAEQQSFERNLPFQRGGAPEPGISGYFSNDKIYSSGGRALDRSTLKSY